ncbi:5-methyltetrahydropteroyltriglutamate--homocysteine S-methyltransferase [Buchnera aphidicola]|uniref:5-methyltetrahydropteroyltriglutamate--homocysteine methyltransferase n=1 Tax=Buchnera aphidicola (Therioaphis trifolii) TaxID=1241884 RepID=A0A4D6YPB8_9GAMM|nr:5-methyltetrahydropteroyltriglutamate--homocysteine S-methyltransferase [Buchnera aphidicola]QCI27035.1 5-methyltetrahydropteroyltriglutamate--homocysteine S-methyltransferase [Buchnera aphidicola (Therioaphis trifolii)]
MAMMNHILGFPRIGSNRELKTAQENYWSGKISREQLLDVGSYLRLKHWKQQKKLGLNILPVGDFSWYDHVLTTSMLLGNIPTRHKNKDDIVDLDTLFYIARGTAVNKKPVLASEMTKWFNTNYHYIVPEFIKDQTFSLTWCQIFDEIDEALHHGYKVKPILLGPMTYLWLGKVKGIKFNRLNLLKNLLPVYQEILLKMKDKGITWVQIDEPILALDLPKEWLKEFQSTYSFLSGYCKLLLTTYFENIEHNLNTIIKLSINGLHIDLIDGKYNLIEFNNKIPNDWLLSLGVINGRNIWKSDLKYWFNIIQPILNYRKNIWISSSCSLLHCPVDLNYEKNIPIEVKNWFSFALQKCYEINLLTKSLKLNDSKILEEWSNLLYTHSYSNKINNISVRKKINKINESDINRNTSYNIRSKKQKLQFNLPILPTTTIGSFPQTKDIRKLRLDYKNKRINFKNYNLEIKKHIKNAILQQELLDIDVLVHGEFERNDMVEYFGEHLNGFVFTDFGWVQSYGSRCVKPPIIIGDVYRSKPITVDWLKYAQSLTYRPVKAMLTGPVTILLWSFLREDLPKQIISNQIALALRDEVSDLEREGINIIQIDEPALREGLPLRKLHWNQYLSWATKSFKLSSSKVKDTTQIHTHMCYCEFQDIMNAIVELDADVITIETARSDMELLQFFKEFKYPNEIGPGVYDIHSPNIPSILDIEKLLNEAMKYIPIERLWVNPDCGLKTRNWKETNLALKNMILATKNIRNKIL